MVNGNYRVHKVFSYSLSLSTCWIGMNGCLLYSVAAEVLGSWRDSLGDVRGEQGVFMGGGIL